MLRNVFFRPRWAVLPGLMALALIPHSAPAQTVAPSQVTPPTLRPEKQSGASVSVPPTESLEAPAGSERLSTSVGKVTVDGGFSEMAAADAQAAASLEERTVTVAEIYRAAATLEAAYAGAGFVLARVVVPPQELVNGGQVRLLIIDGFVESIDTHSLPSRARRGVAASLGKLVGRKHVRMAEIERRLLVAATVPGLRLRSTLVRGSTEGGTVLVVDGRQRLVSGSAGVDNYLPSSLGNSELNASVALNSALGLGEQVYVSGATGVDLRRAFAGNDWLHILGGGAVVPLGGDGLTLNPEYTSSVTRPKAGVGVPESTGYFERAALRASYPVVLRRDQQLLLQVGFEHVDEHLLANGFATELYRDDYHVARLGADWSRSLQSGQTFELNGTYAQGVSGRTQRDAEVADVPLSRQFAEPEFHKLELDLHFNQPLPQGLQTAFVARGQISFGQALMRAEQFSLDGVEGVSGFPTGTFTTDSGVTLRSELSRPFSLPQAAYVTLSPYVFGSGGRGYDTKPTAVEQRSIEVGAVGIGMRGASLYQSVFAVEVARQFSDITALHDEFRVDANIGMRF